MALRPDESELRRLDLNLLPVFVAQGDSDAVIPGELLARTWSYLHTESGAPTQGHRDPGGHGITPTALQQLSGWLQARLVHVVTHSTTSPAADSMPGAEVAWPRRPFSPVGKR